MELFLNSRHTNRKDVSRELRVKCNPTFSESCATHVSLNFMCMQNRKNEHAPISIQASQAKRTNFSIAYFCAPNHAAEIIGSVKNIIAFTGSLSLVYWYENASVAQRWKNRLLKNVNSVHQQTNLTMLWRLRMLWNINSLAKNGRLAIRLFLLLLRDYVCLSLSIEWAAAERKSRKVTLSLYWFIKFFRLESRLTSICI